MVFNFQKIIQAQFKRFAEKHFQNACSEAPENKKKKNLIILEIVKKLTII